MTTHHATVSWRISGTLSAGSVANAEGCCSARRQFSGLLSDGEVKAEQDVGGRGAFHVDLARVDSAEPAGAYR
jgi:hypothetical protein